MPMTLTKYDMFGDHSNAFYVISGESQNIPEFFPAEMYTTMFKPIDPPKEYRISESRQRSYSDLPPVSPGILAGLPDKERRFSFSALPDEGYETNKIQVEKDLQRFSFFLPERVTVDNMLCGLRHYLLTKQSYTQGYLDSSLLYSCVRLDSIKIGLDGPDGFISDDCDEARFCSQITLNTPDSCGFQVLNMMSVMCEGRIEHMLAVADRATYPNSKALLYGKESFFFSGHIFNILCRQFDEHTGFQNLLTRMQDGMPPGSNMPVGTNENAQQINAMYACNHGAHLREEFKPVIREYLDRREIGRPSTSGFESSMVKHRFSKSLQSIYPRLLLQFIASGATHDTTLISCIQGDASAFWPQEIKKYLQRIMQKALDNYRLRMLIFALNTQPEYEEFKNLILLSGNIINANKSEVKKMRLAIERHGMPFLKGQKLFSGKTLTTEDVELFLKDIGPPPREPVSNVPIFPTEQKFP